MKVAFATDDGKTISRHFGQAQHYVVVDTEEKAQTHELRDKAYHGAQHEHGPGHTHADMFASIGDCQVLVVGGMGTPAYEAARQHGLQVIATGLADIPSALQAYGKGALQNDPDRIHRPGTH